MPVPQGWENPDIPILPESPPPPPPPPSPTLDANTLARLLAAPSTGYDESGIPRAGWTARDLEEWVASTPPDSAERWLRARMANDAMIIKDSWLRGAGQFRSGEYPGQFAAPVYAGAAGSLTSWNPWVATRIPGSFGQPVRSFQMPDVTWASLPQQYRDPLANWFRQVGFRPSAAGGMGTYGFRSYESQNPYSFNPEAFANIPDANLRAWAQWLFGQGAQPA